MNGVPPTSEGAGLSHDLRELNHPLTAILIDAEAALRWLARDPVGSAEAREAIERIIVNSQRLAGAIRGLRSIPLSPAPADRLDLNDTVRSLVELVRSDLRRHGIAIETELAPALAPIRGDQGELAKVLANLIANGAEAMRSVRDRPRRLRISSWLDGADGVVIAVADSGSGIGPEPADRLFEYPVTPRSQGRGLGLAMCRSIVEAHGGRLWATPNSPHGSIFSFSIPGCAPG